jgi:dCMP deaminase
MSDQWDRRFLELARHIAQWSKDPSTKVGAVLVDPEMKYVVGMGYNGFARGVYDTVDRLNDRPTKYRFVVHAEVNACIVAGERARGAVLYVWPSFLLPPICADCAKVAIQCGVAQVVGYEESDIGRDVDERWRDSILAAREMLLEAGVAVRGVS